MNTIVKAMEFWSAFQPGREYHCWFFKKKDWDFQKSRYSAPEHLWIQRKTPQNVIWITGVSRHSIQAYCMGEYGDSLCSFRYHIYRFRRNTGKEYLSIHPEYWDKWIDKISNAEDKVRGFHIVEAKS